MYIHQKCACSNMLEDDTAAAPALYDVLSVGTSNNPVKLRLVEVYSGGSDNGEPLVEGSADGNTDLNAKNADEIRDEE